MASGYLDVEKGQFVFLLLFNGKGNVGVLSVDVFMKPLQLLLSPLHLFFVRKLKRSY